MDEPTKALAEELVEAMRPLDVRTRAMFGGYTFYLDGKVVGLVNDGRVLVKRSSAEASLDGLAELAAAYPGTRESWRLTVEALGSSEDAVRAAIRSTADALPAARRR